MHFITALLPLLPSLTLTLAGSLSVPTDLANGLYSITRFDNGSFSAPTLLQAMPDTNSKRAIYSSLIEERTLPNPQIGCSNRGTNAGDMAVTRNGLNKWCDQGNTMPGNSYQWFTYNSAQSYICNYSGNRQGCSSGEYNDANSLIDTACGGGQAGWVRINDWAKAYGRDNSGVSQCF
ncbi:hypothetical protein BGZ60DRAFT_556087 [Tricladium varicosporioides]|nr:hypothetical protein BGZ60DRAFT_556087 [Hymenoscyphus varicosporioides]